MGLPTKELAVKLAISRSFVALLETGKRLPKKAFLPRIAEVLAVDREVINAWYLEDIREKLQ